MKKLIYLSIIFCTILSCTRVLPITKSNYSGIDAAEVIVLRKASGLAYCAMLYIKVDDEVICRLNSTQYTKFYLKPGTHSFQAIPDDKFNFTWLGPPMDFNLEAGKTYYFRPNNAYWSGKFFFFQISEIEFNNYTAIGDYTYIPIEKADETNEKPSRCKNLNKDY